MQIETSAPRAYSPRDAAKQASVGLTLLYSEISKGRLRKLKVGRRSLITAAAIQDWLALLEAEQRAGSVKETAPRIDILPARPRRRGVRQARRR